MSRCKGCEGVVGGDGWPLLGVVLVEEWLWLLWRGGLIELLQHLPLLCGAQLHDEAHDVFGIGLKAGLSVCSVG